MHQEDILCFKPTLTNIDISVIEQNLPTHINVFKLLKVGVFPVHKDVVLPVSTCLHTAFWRQCLTRSLIQFQQFLRLFDPKAAARVDRGYDRRQNSLQPLRLRDALIDLVSGNLEYKEKKSRADVSDASVGMQVSDC